MIEMGVLRQVVHFWADLGDDSEPDFEVVGSLIAHVEEPGPDDELILGDVVMYTLGLDRLRDLLTMAARGDDIDGLILSLDAVALASDEPDDDGETT